MFVQLRQFERQYWKPFCLYIQEIIYKIGSEICQGPVPIYQDSFCFWKEQ